MRLKDSYHPCAATTILFWSMAFVFTGDAVEVSTVLGGAVILAGLVLFRFGGGARTLKKHPEQLKRS